MSRREYFPAFWELFRISGDFFKNAGECADLSRSGNVPWPCQAVRQAAVELSTIGRERHGLEITLEAWERYLTADMPQGPQRETLFQLAMVTGMISL